MKRTRVVTRVVAISLFASLLFAGQHAANAETCAIRFGVIGDYGSAGSAERDVASLVKSWNPDLILTVGDNNYENGAASTIDQNIGQYYSDFIFPYRGAYGQGAAGINRFYPTLGNHDWAAPGARPYLDYFSLPGNQRYYDFTWGPVHFFALDSDPSEPDGVTSNSIQANWLRARLAAAPEPWKVVYFHHSPYSSGLEHGSTEYMRWPFQAWGATAVLSGHDHDYERINRDGFTFFVNGLGGKSKYRFFILPVSGSQKRYNSDYGAMLIDANDSHIIFKFISRKGDVIDDYMIGAAPRRAPAPPSGLVAAAASKRRIDLAWTVEGCSQEGFKIEQSQDGVSFTEVATTSANLNAYSVTGLSRNTTYYFRVRAYNSAGQSAYSNVGSATTLKRKRD